MRKIVLSVRAKRQVWAWIAAGVALLGMYARCEAHDLVMSVTPSALSLPIDVALAEGFFAAEGIGVRVVDCTTGPRCLQQLLDREVQMTASTELPVVMSSFSHSSHAIVASIASSARNIRIVGRKSSGVAEPSQLAGKRIGVIVGTSSHYFLDAYLLFYGLDPKKIQLVGLQPENILAAIQRREIDAFAGYSRHIFPILKALGSDAALLSDPRIYTETYNLVVDRKTLAQREAEIVKVLRALASAERFIIDHPQRAKELIHTRTRLDAADIDSIFPSFNYRLTLDQSLVSAMEGQARWALREGHVSAVKSPNFLNFIEAAPLRKALAGAAGK